MSNPFPAARDAVPVWRELRRIFRIALDPRKLLLAGLGLALLWCGDWAIAQLPFGGGNAPAAPWERVGPIPPWHAIFAGSDGWIAILDSILLAAWRILTPIGPLLEIVGLPFSNPRSWSDLALLWTRFLWSLAVWSVCGGAIARLAAVEFAKRERVALWSGLSFALIRFLSFFTAPLLPIAAVLLLWGLTALGGTLGHIPYVGEMLVALLWGLAFCLGLLIVLITIATAAGWPLMVAGIAAESSDAFDGFSRSFSYLYGRPWLFAWCVAVALLAGGILTLFVEQAAILVAEATARTVSTGYERDHADIRVIIGDSLHMTYRRDGSSDIADRVISGWHALLFLLAAGFSTSVFWSAATAIYFIIRRADDGTSLDEVWIDDPPPDDDLLPLAGIAATGQPVTECTHHPTVENP